MPARSASKFAFLCLLMALGLWLPSAARADDAAIQTTWRLLDYVAVDYPEAVEAGRIVNQFEYDEMREFSQTVTRRLAELPAKPERDALVDSARALETVIASRGDAAEVERRSRALGRDLLAAYPVPLAPDRVPNLAGGEAVYQQNCASCHGPDGAARIPAAAALDPPPIDFTDRARAAERSLFALYQVIDQGLEGTSMQSFAHLPVEDRWTLAFRTGQFAYPASLVEQGRQIWEGDAAIRAIVPDLAALVALTPSDLARRVGEARAVPLTAFLRHHPEIVEQGAKGGTIALARDRLRQSLAAYRSGDRAAATEHALAAYLDGFEPVEAVLAARDSALVAEVERAMGEYRAAIGRGRPAEEVATIADMLLTLFDRSEAALAPEAADATSTFLGAFAILLREGLEALLIVIAMITFLVRADRRDLLKYVHAGWIAALLAGLGTWWAATTLIEISGADRELTEGFGALLAAIVLIFVGIWMHDKSQAGAWQAYVRDRLGHALGRGSIWLLFGLSFVAVYREVFETIIFYAAIGAQGDRSALLGGAATAALLLALIAWAMLRYAKRLPIERFFRYSAILIAVLAVILAGKGFAALQEAGLIGVTPLGGFPRSPLLGLYPTLETLGAQAFTILLLLGFYFSRRPRAGSASTG